MSGSSPGRAGVLLVDKPAGPTSHDLVARARRALSERRIGHAGTLDPFASGLLVLCVGSATRLAEYFTALDKDYETTVRLGQRTPTHDSESPVERESEDWRRLSLSEVEAALAVFRGPLRQVPPLYSAKKLQGERAYRMARRGERPELAPAEVTVHALELVAFEPPFVHLRLSCSSGTYVRALARDLGEVLGVGAHLTALRRTRVGPFSVEEALPAAGLDDPAAAAGALLPAARAVSYLPSVTVEGGDAARLVQGRDIEDPEAPREGDAPVAVLLEGALLAVAVSEGGRLRPRKVFAAPAP